MNLELVKRFIPGGEEEEGYYQPRWGRLANRVRPSETPPEETSGALTLQVGDLVKWDIPPGRDPSYWSREQGRAARGLVMDIHWSLLVGFGKEKTHYYPAAVIAWSDDKATLSDHRSLRLVSRPAEIIKSKRDKKRQSRATTTEEVTRGTR
jgi:hypothetical protein